MSFRIKKPHSVAVEVRRIAIKQIDKSIAELGDESLDRHEAVHQVRKRFKKIRGLLRLVRPGLGIQYDAANAWYRDAGRELSRVRDAEAMLEAVRLLQHRYGEQVDPNVFSTISAALKTRKATIESEWNELSEMREELSDRLEEQRDRIFLWELKGDPVDAVFAGLRKSYDQGRQVLKELSLESTDEQWHRWRKCCKYHWHHLMLLRGVWPVVINGFITAASELSERLGDDHDLAILAEHLKSSPMEHGGESNVNAVLGFVSRHRQKLQRQALRLGQRLYAEKPRAMTSRLETCWQVWSKKKRC